jgi:hypothetical protein
VISQAQQIHLLVVDLVRDVIWQTIDVGLSILNCCNMNNSILFDAPMLRSEEILVMADIIQKINEESSHGFHIYNTYIPYYPTYAS